MSSQANHYTQFNMLCKSLQMHQKKGGALLHQQGRGHEVGPTVCLTLENLDLVHRETSDSKGLTHSRPLKCSGGQTIQIGTDHPDRIVPPSRGFSGPVQQVAPASNRSLTRFNHKLPLFVSPVPDPMATAVYALSLSWENLDAYAFPPTAILGKVVEKLQDSPYQRLIIIAPGWPNMTWDLVEMSSQIPLLLPQLPNLLTQPDPSQKSDKPKSPCMAPRATAIKEQGFSEAVATRIEAPQRGSTRSVYEAKWTIFTKWFVTNQVDFRAPPVKSVANFLM